MTCETPWPYSGPRKRPSPLRESTPRPSWAGHALRLEFPDGTVLDTFPIGALATAVNKSSYTIRRWVREGTLPETPLCLLVAGRAPRRRFTLAQIEGIALIAHEEGIAHRKPADIASTDFAERVRRLYEQLFPELFPTS